MTRAIVLRRHGGPEVLGAELTGATTSGIQSNGLPDRASLTAVAGEALAAIEVETDLPPAQSGGAHAALESWRTADAAVFIP